MPLKRRGAGFGHLLVLVDGPGADSYGADYLAAAAQRYAAGEDDQPVAGRVAQAEELLADCVSEFSSFIAVWKAIAV